MKKSGKMLSGIAVVSVVAGMCVVPAVAPEMSVTAYAEETNYTWVVEPTIEADDIIVVDTDENYVNQTIVDKICAGFALGEHGYDAYETVVFKIGGTVGIMDYSGKILETNEKHNAFSTQDGKIDVRFFYQEGWPDDPPYFHEYDEDKNIVKDMYGISYSGDKSVLVGRHDDKWNWHYGIFKGNQFIEPMDYEDGKMNYVSNNEIIALCKDGKWGYFNGNGEQIIDFVCDSIKYVPNSALGLAVTGFSADDMGTNITENDNYNDSISVFMGSDGYIPVKIDGKCAYYNYNGEEVIPQGVFEETRPVHNGLAWVKYDGKWGVIDIANNSTPVSATTTTTTTTETTTTTTVSGAINTTTAIGSNATTGTVSITENNVSSTTTKCNNNNSNDNNNNNSSNNNSSYNNSSSGKSSPKTGVAGVGMAVTGIFVAIGTAFVFRKKDN